MKAGADAVRLYYRRIGCGKPLVFLHGGWGYEVYSFDLQIEELRDKFEIVIPDRTGYGRSEHVDNIEPDFHQRAAVETVRFLKALGIVRPVLWGHSDGAVIAALMALDSPDDYAALILEAFHYYRAKPASRGFFETMAQRPSSFGEKITSVLIRDHGEDYWEKLIAANGYAWLRIAKESRHMKDDLYNGRLSRLAVPTLFIHGERDPRTEPDEMTAVQNELRRSRSTEFKLLEGAGHSPHSNPAVSAEIARAVWRFLEVDLERS